jgi:hypothetical protein
MFHPINATKSAGMVVAGDPIRTTYNTVKGALTTAVEPLCGVGREAGHLATVLTLGMYSYNNESWGKALLMAGGGEVLNTAVETVGDAAGTVAEPFCGVGREVQHAACVATIGFYSGPWEKKG